MATLPNSVQQLEVLATTIRQEKKNQLEEDNLE